MYGSIDILYVKSSILDFDFSGSVEQANCFIIAFGSDMNSRTVSNNSVLLFDNTINDYIDCYVYYTKKMITLTPKTEALVPGRTYVIRLVSGDAGVKDIFGNFIDSDIDYSITFDDTVIIKKPAILSPANNSITDSLSINVDMSGSDSSIVELSDDINFATFLIQEQVSVWPYVPAVVLDLGKQYYLRVKNYKQITNETTAEIYDVYSEYTDVVQFYFKSINQAVIPPAAPDIDIFKMIPNNGYQYLSDNTINIITTKDLTGYTYSTELYSTNRTNMQLYFGDLDSFVAAGFATLVKTTSTPDQTAPTGRFISIKLSATPALNSIFFLKLIITDSTSTVVYNNVLSFGSPSRYLYIDYDYISDSLDNLNVTQDYVMSKVLHACDRADHFVLINVDPTNVKYKVKEYVKYKTLLDIMLDFQLGYIDSVNGAIGSFQFTLAGSSQKVEDAINYIKSEVIFWQKELISAYDKPLRVTPDYAQRGGDTLTARTPMNIAGKSSSGS